MIKEDNLSRLNASRLNSRMFLRTSVSKTNAFLLDNKIGASKGMEFPVR